MISLFKKTLKIGVVTAGLVAVASMGAYAVAGKDRTNAVVHDLHGKVMEKIDAAIDDPSAMRAQLREMEKEYPERIAQVRSDLAEIQHEIRQLERESAISSRVVALADQDLERLETQLASQVPSGNELVAIRSVKLDDHVYSVDRARVRLNQIKNTRLAHANRSADAKHDLMYLEKQEGRLAELQTKLEGERAEFQTQISGLSRQIDAIARNDRLIKLLDKRNRTIDECSRYESISLDQITGRLASIKSRQEAELDLLANTEEQSDYEDLARMQIATEQLEDQHGELLQRELSDY